MTLPRFNNALFISDLHLTEDRPDCTRAFFRFLDWLPTSTDALFILGDFFEYWVGDDLRSELADRIAQGLADVAQNKQIALYFIAGNRDFSLGADYCRRCNMTLLPDEMMIEIAHQPVHISHGDQFCTDDIAYQRFRRIIRHRWTLKLLLALPRSRRIALAEKLRQRSQQRFQANPVYVDVNEDAVAALIRRQSPACVVHGHTHLADIHQPQKTAQRMVLGDWHDYGWYGAIDASGPSLHRFRISDPEF